MHRPKYANLEVRGHIRHTEEKSWRLREGSSCRHLLSRQRSRVRVSSPPPFIPKELAHFWKIGAIHKKIHIKRHPLATVSEAVLDAARREGITPKHVQDIITAQQAIHLVAEHVGVAILTQPAVGVSAQGVVVKPLSNASLCFETFVILRTDDDSRLANEFARSFIRRYEPQRPPPTQMELWLSA
jgi:hypothetical protein